MAKTWNDKVKFVIKNCYFSNNLTTGAQSIYNLMEPNVQWADGSEISGCTFSEGSCSHNHINIYDVENGATVTIKNNVFDKSANAIRVGVRGAKEATFNLMGNQYDTTDAGDWAGLFLVQPYGSATTDMSGLVINCNGTINNSGESQIGYYAAKVGSDTQLEEAKRPLVYINGVEADYSADVVSGNYTVSSIV